MWKNVDLKTEVSSNLICILPVVQSVALIRNCNMCDFLQICRTGSGTTIKETKTLQIHTPYHVWFGKILGLLRGLVISGLQEITHTIISDLG